MVMHDVCMASRQQRESSFRSNHIYRLPQAVKDEHRLIEGSIHDGFRA